jgi:hypothetical protein
LGRLIVDEIKVKKIENARKLKLGKEDGGNKSWNMKLKSSKING